MQLYLDCDGVLADFDRGATELLGMPPRVFEKRLGLPAFWREIARHPDFLWHSAADAGCDDAVRSGAAPGSHHPDWPAARQMGCPAEGALGGRAFPGTRILTVMAVDKRNHCRSGDILVDDQLKHAHLWQDAGGTFVHHRSAEQTLAELSALGVPVMAAPAETAHG